MRCQPLFMQRDTTRASLSESVPQVALNSPDVAVEDVAHNHLHKLLLAGKTPAVIAFPFQDASETSHEAII